MNFITIDFSLNSPGICVFNNNQYHFISYIKRNGSKKAIKMQEELSLLDDTTLVFQPDWETHVDYSSVELAKIKRYDIMSNDIIELITKHVDKEDSFKIAFEGVGRPKYLSESLISSKALYFANLIAPNINGNELKIIKYVKFKY